MYMFHLNDQPYTIWNGQTLGSPQNGFITMGLFFVRMIFSILHLKKLTFHDNSPSDGRGHKLPISSYILFFTNILNMESQTRLGLQDMCCAWKKKKERYMNSEDDFPDLDAINRAVPAVPWWCLWLACWTRLTNAWGIRSAIGVTWLRLRWFQLDCWRVEK